MVEMHFLRSQLFQEYMKPTDVDGYERDLYAKILHPVFGRLLHVFTGVAPVIGCMSTFAASPGKPDLYHSRCNLYLKETQGTMLTDWRDHEDSLKICEIASECLLHGESHVFFWLGNYYPIEDGVMMQRALFIARPVREKMILRGIEMRLLYASSMSLATELCFAPVATPLITFGEWLVSSSIIAYCC